ncbi:protein YLS9 [Pyrus ussuriensis x Pyrus communis]|uniref:Protein YLS9 n=1 Tax=Pyrus ussuriensis x Pyrus communis TaxID=2448454 RepID=A0A5N5I0U8_9ROSA|nr:protein YLS9 [Pyrus ussuriensis x Pyrus communis]
MSDHQRVRVHPAGDVEAQPTALPPVPPVVPLHGHGSSSSSTEKATEKIKLLQTNNLSAPLQLPVVGRTINPVIQANPPKKRSSCTCCRCMWWTMGILLLVLIIIGATAGILYLIFHPKLPNYSITANNPNKKIGIYYEKGGRLSVWYTNTRLCQGMLPKFYQGHQNKTLLNVDLTGQTQYGSTLMNALQQQQQTGRIPLVLKVNAPVAIKLGKLKLRKVTILGECLLVVDSLSANNLISIKANNCRFRMKL